MDINLLSELTYKKFQIFIDISIIRLRQNFHQLAIISSMHIALSSSNLPGTLILKRILHFEKSK